MGVTIQSLIDRYKSRTKKLRVQFVIFLVIAVPLVLGIALYLKYSYGQFTKLTHPVNVTDMAYSALSDQVPLAAANLELYLIENADDHVAHSFRLADQVLPEVSELTRDAIDSMLAHDLSTVEEVFDSYLDTILAKDHKEILLVAQSNDPLEVQKLSLKLQQEIESRFRGEWDDKIDKIYASLEDIDSELNLLLKTDPDYLTPEQRLEIRLLTLMKKTADKHF